MIYVAPADPALRRMLLPSIIRITTARQQLPAARPSEPRHTPRRRQGLRQLLLEL
jgi:hypothetical protein